ncbi:MAG: hypothetical protein ABI446_12355 [Gemmatimonadaceae bacterium]
MSEGLLFLFIFSAIFIARIVFATMFFHAVLPDSDRCPECDTPTLRVKSRGWNLLMPWFRTSWCYDCGWRGLLRHGHLTPSTTVLPKRERPTVRRDD